MTERLLPAMKSIFLLATLLFSSAFAQDAYKCKTLSGYQYQDRPCKVEAPPDRPKSSRVPTAAPQAAPATVLDTQERLERDKRYLAERAYIREKTEAREAVITCESQATYLQQQVEQIAGAQLAEYAPNLAGLSQMQLDETRRQTELSGAQSKVEAKRRECDEKRRTAESFK